MSTTDRLSSSFVRCRDENRAALVGYLTAGDPNPETSGKLLQALADQVDVLEIGMPFSDPMADGPVIQAASERALAAGTKMNDVFQLAASVRAQHADIGIVLMGYANVAYAMGYNHFAERAAAAGVDGVLLVDIPPEEAGELDAVLQANGVCSIRLLAPTSSEARRKLAADSASGFIYYVSLTGITGAQMGDMDEVRAQVENIRTMTPLPVCVGFGVKTPEQVSQVAAFADGVVVGSHFVSQITEHLSDTAMMADAVAEAASRMRDALGKGV